MLCHEFGKGQVLGLVRVPKLRKTYVHGFALCVMAYGLTHQEILP